MRLSPLSYAAISPIPQLSKRQHFRRNFRCLLDVLVIYPYDLFEISHQNLHATPLLYNYYERSLIQCQEKIRRRVAINPSITIFDYSIIERNTREISAIRTTLNRYIFTIEYTNNYLPKEAESMVQYMKKIFEVQNALLEKLRKQRITIYDCEAAGATCEPKGLI